MQPRSFEERLAMLEKQMPELRELPKRVTDLQAQFVQLRQEMRDGFSAIRSEMRTGFAELGAQMRLLHEDVLSRIATIAEGRQSRKR
jgi:chromosome segregation ATPase